MEYQKSKCGDCVHFVRASPSATDLAPKVGECRYNPPGVSMIPTDRGPLRMSCYPCPSIDNAACSKFEKRLQLKLNGR